MTEDGHTVAPDFLVVTRHYAESSIDLFLLEIRSTSGTVNAFK